MTIDEFVTSLHSVITIIELTVSLAIIILQSVTTILTNIPNVRRSGVGRFLNAVSQVLKDVKLKLRRLSTTVIEALSLFKKVKKL